MFAIWLPKWMAKHFNDSLSIVAGNEPELPSNEKDSHSLYSIIMWTMWKGAQHTAKRDTTVTIITTARFFFLGPQGYTVSVNFPLADVSSLDLSVIIFTCKWSSCMLSLFSCVWLLVTLRTVARQAPLSMRFSGQEHQSGLPFPSPGDLPNPGIEPSSRASSIGRQVLYHWATWEACLKFLEVGGNYFPAS